MSSLTDIMKKRHNTQFFTDEVPEKSVVDNILQEAHKLTPHKNNFYRYKINVWGPEHIEENIESTYQKFANAVAKYRNLTVEAVIATEADCFEGQKGIDLGLADRMAAPQDAINQITQNIVRNSATSSQQSIAVQAAHLRMKSQL